MRDTAQCLPFAAIHLEPCFPHQKRTYTCESAIACLDMCIWASIQRSLYRLFMTMTTDHSNIVFGESFRFTLELVKVRFSWLKTQAIFLHEPAIFEGIGLWYIREAALLLMINIFFLPRCIVKCVSTVAPGVMAFVGERCFSKIAA